MNDSQPKELIDLQEKVAEIFWYVKSQAKLARGNIERSPVSRSGDLDETERSLHKQLQDLGCQLLGGYLKDLDRGDMGYRVILDDQEYERGHRQRSERLLSIFGLVSYYQSIYYNGKGDSLRPLAVMANLPERKSSYFTQEVMSRLGIEDTYLESQGFYADFFGHSLSPRTIEEVIGDMQLSYSDYDTEKSLPEATVEKSIGVVSFDGKGIPVVKSEQTTGKTREALVGCVYTVNARERNIEDIVNSLVPNSLSLLKPDEKKEQPGGAQSIEYYGSVTQPKESVFGDVHRRALDRFTACSITTVVCLLDGAPCLWRLAKKHFPNAVYILDIIHVLDYLWKAVKALKTDQRDIRILVRTYLTEILQGNVKGVITGLKIRLTKNQISGSQREDIQSAITYFENHKDYMRYGEYLNAGYPIATGVIESACGHVIKNRLCKAGAKWRLNGAESVLKLRCIRASGSLKEFHKIRKQSEENRLYSGVLKKAA